MCVYRPPPAHHVAEEAFDIAWQFLRDGTSEPSLVQSFIADVIDRQIASGDRNRIRLANKAIKAIQANNGSQ
jgi:hypothetical protein